MDKEKGKRNKRTENEKSKEKNKNHNQVEAYIWTQEEPARMAGGWPQRLYLRSSTPITMYPMYAWIQGGKNDPQK